MLDDVRANIVNLLQVGFPEVPALVALADGSNAWPVEIVATRVMMEREGDGADAGTVFPRLFSSKTVLQKHVPI